MVDVVDAADVVVTMVPRALMRRHRLRHRATFVVVRSTDGRILVHRRSDGKDLWPGRWDLAVGGVVTAGEGYDDAARRELAEEVGVTGGSLVPLGSGRFRDPDVHLVARLYEVVHDGPFTFTDGEVVEARFVTLGELRTRLATDLFVPDSAALLVPLLSDRGGPAHTPVRHPNDRGERDEHDRRRCRATGRTRPHPDQPGPVDRERDEPRG